MYCIVEYPITTSVLEIEIISTELTSYYSEHVNLISRTLTKSNSQDMVIFSEIHYINRL